MIIFNHFNNQFLILIETYFVFLFYHSQLNIFGFQKQLTFINLGSDNLTQLIHKERKQTKKDNCTKLDILYNVQYVTGKYYIIVAQLNQHFKSRLHEYYQP